MSQQTAPTPGPLAETERVLELGAHHAGTVRMFLWHLAQMMIAMMLGMVVGYGTFLAIIGTNGDQARHLYPTTSLVVMALSMTMPMVAWMRFRRHTWRDSIEMGSAMLLPAVPFLVCLWAHVFRDAPNGPYMMVSTAAMIGLMIYRWNVYSMHPAKPIPVRGV